jgi:charged multivesicular body protein 3
VIEEMMNDAIDMRDEDDIEEEAAEEVDKILYELTDGLLGEIGPVGKKLKVTSKKMSYIEAQ